jgi:hypothetical protein
LGAAALGIVADRILGAAHVDSALVLRDRGGADELGVGEADRREEVVVDLGLDEDLDQAAVDDVHRDLIVAVAVLARHQPGLIFGLGRVSRQQRGAGQRCRIGGSLGLGALGIPQADVHGHRRERHEQRQPDGEPDGAEAPLCGAGLAPCADVGRMRLALHGSHVSDSGTGSRRSTVVSVTVRSPIMPVTES